MFGTPQNRMPAAAGEIMPHGMTPQAVNDEDLGEKAVAAPDWLCGVAAWEALIDCSGAAVYVVDEHFVHVYVNERGAAVVGLKPESMIGAPMSGHVSNALTEMVKAFIVKALQSGTVGQETTLFQGELLRSHFVPIRSQGNRFDHVLIVSHATREHRPTAGSLQLLQNPETRAEAMGPLAKLTPRELEILTFIAERTKTSDIALALKLSERTVHNHCASISKKLGGTTRSEMAQLSIRAGLTRPHQATGDAPDGPFPRLTDSTAN